MSIELKNNTIKKIVVTDLFGYLNYTIPSDESGSNFSDLIFLYGNNGCGKTTILNLVYYLFSTIDNKGHKSRIARIKFKRFSIILNSGIEIGAERESSKIGSFRYYLIEKNKIKYDVFLKADNEFVIRPDNTNDEKLARMFKYIQKLDISLYYLTDERNIYNNISFQDDISESNYDPFKSSIESFKYKIEKKQTEPKINVESAIKKLNYWIIDQHILSSFTGEESNNSIYINIVDRIKHSRKLSKKKLSNSIEELYKIFESLISRSEQYTKYGLFSFPDSIELINTLNNKTLSDKKREILLRVIEPYIKGIESKLDKLFKLQSSISIFIDSINSYFDNKEIEYHLQSGFAIKSKYTDEPIEFNNLSSGERQLLLLFCNAILATDKASICIIDEPEISLNFTWQRKLVKTLLQFNKFNHIQYIFATHSIELITSYNKNAVKLDTNRTYEF